MALNSSISNIIGTKIPYWLWQQLNTRSQKTASEKRDAEIIKFITNKTAWVRLVSSIDIKEDDLNWFKKINPEITTGEDLAKQYVLFGGTSKYLGNNSYGLRSGFSGLGSNPSYGGAYGIIGDTKDAEMGNEISKYGYRPMPGITNVSVETQGKLGSVRAATVNFKCWDKMQLDVIDALYFKLGFSMFLEWGQTYYFPSENSDTAIGSGESKNGRPPADKAISTELYSIDPFDQNYRNNKERLLRTISENNRKTEGNYEAMLGIVTNFNFSMNQEGGYDCMVKIISLGVLGDSIKVNHSSKLVNILEEQVQQYESILKAINAARPLSGSTGGTGAGEKGVGGKTIQSVLVTYAEQGKGKDGKENEPVFMSSDEVKPSGAKIDAGELGDFLYFKNLNKFLNLNTEKNNVFINLDADYVTRRLSEVGIDPSLKKLSVVDSKGFDQPGWKKIFDEYQYAVRYSPTVDRTNEKKYDKPFFLIKNQNKPSDLFLIFKFPYSEGESIAQDKLANFLVNKDALNTYITSRLGKLGYTTNDSTEYKLTVVDPKNYIEKVSGKSDRINVSLADEWYQKVFYSTWKNFLNSPKFTIDGKRTYVKIENRNGNRVPIFRVKATVNATLLSDVEVEDVSRTTDNLPFNPSQEVLTKEGLISEGTGDIITLLRVPVTYFFELEMEFTDAKFIKDITVSEEIQKLQPPTPDPPPAPPAPAPQTPDSAQTVNPFTYLSNIELMLRSIQVHSLVVALKKYGKKDPNSTTTEGILLNQVVPVNLVGDGKNSKSKNFIEQLFSNGIFTKYISGPGDLINGTIGDEITGDQEKDFAVYAKYGFATKLMSNQAPVSKFTKVDYGNSKESLMNVYVLPHNVTQELESGLALNHPVYIQFGLFLMMLNHSCTLYNPDAKTPSPVVYIDFNPNHNFCLTSPLHMTVDPMVAVIPFEGSLSQYAKLFDKNLISKDEKYSLKPVSGSKETTFLLRPRNVENYQAKDRVSGGIPAFIDNKSLNDNVNRGRVMNILINIDYLTNTIKQYAKKDGENKVFLKPLLEEILTCVNKALGSFNIFRLAYNDVGNVFHIVDDQIVPVGDANEEQPYTAASGDPTEIPVFGKNSIAKNLEIKTEVSTRLANMLAISANSQGEQGQNSTDGSTFGFINYNYADRYITKRSELETTGSTSIDINGELQSATQFNEAMLNFYSRGILDQNSIATATNYYISKLTKNKSEDSATRAAAMIPVSLNFTTDGISGLYMGQAFTVSRDFLPYTYSIKKMFNGEPADNKVGFVITGVNHTIEGNVWNTSVKTNMIFLKSKSDYTTGSVADRKIEQVSEAPVIPSKVFTQEKSVPSTPNGCERKKGTLDEEIVKSTIIKDAYGNYVKGKKTFVAKLEQAYKVLESKGIKLKIGDNLRSFEFQKSSYENFLKNVELQKQGKPWFKNGKTYPPTQKPDNIAHPCSGFHVLGQAVDLVQNKAQREDITSQGPIYQALYDAGLRRIPNEWWHWSIGEVS